MERIAEAAKHHEPGPAISGHARAASPAAASLPPALELQQLAGNQAMQELLRSGFLQAKLAISNPDDPEEHEADQVAHSIMRKHAGAPCSCSAGEEMCEECQQKHSAPAIQRRASAPAAPAHAPRIVSDVLRSPGHPLDAATRAFFEPRFGRDFSDVRVHTDSHAADSARSIHAHAYTAGSHIAFDAGQYSPATDTGRSLLAHELVHVVHQQGSIMRQADAGAGPPGGETPTDGGAPPVAQAPTAAPDQPGGEHYSKQAACVARLGGCLQTRDAGVVSPEDITRYNEECKKRSEYAGPDITPSQEECRQYSTGQLIDPAKVLRLEDLTLRYLNKLSNGELTVGDSLKIDAALRSAHSALQRGGVSLPSVPPPPVIPPGTHLDRPSVTFVVLAGAFAQQARSLGPPPPPPIVTQGATAPVVESAPALAESAPAVAEGAPLVAEGAPLLAEGAPLVAEGTTTVVGGAAAGGALVTVGVVLIGLAVLVGAGLLIYYVVTLKDPEVDPTIPKTLDESSDTIEQTLDKAKRPVPAPPLPDIGRLPHQRRTKDQTCTNEVLDQLQIEKDQICNSIRGDSCSPSKVSPKRLARRPCSEIRKRIQAFRDCLESRQRIQDECFGGTPDETHEKVFKDLNSGLAACLALEAVNCAPGHPMANL